MCVLRVKVKVLVGDDVVVVVGGGGEWWVEDRKLVVIEWRVVLFYLKFIFILLPCECGDNSVT